MGVMILAMLAVISVLRNQEKSAIEQEQAQPMATFALMETLREYSKVILAAAVRSGLCSHECG